MLGLRHGPPPPRSHTYFQIFSMESSSLSSLTKIPSFVFFAKKDDKRQWRVLDMAWECTDLKTGSVSDSLAIHLSAELVCSSVKWCNKAYLTSPQRPRGVAKYRGYEARTPGSSAGSALHESMLYEFPSLSVPPFPCREVCTRKHLWG